MARPKKIDVTDQAAAKTKEEIQNWLLRIKASEQYRKQMGEKFRWARLIEEYRGYFMGITNATDIYVPSLNLIFAYVKSEIPALYLRDPKIKVNPKKGSSIVAAKILEKALNYLWRTKRIKRENRKNLFDDLLVGHSWFKTGYTGKFGTVENGNKTFEFIESEDFFGYRIPYENITFNPDAVDPPFDCQWIAHEIWITEEEAKANASYDKSVLEQIQFTVLRVEDRINKTVTDNEATRRQDPVTKKAKFYEVWNKIDGTKFVIAEGIWEYVTKPSKWPYEMRGFPFSFLRLNDDPLNPYGIPDCYMFEELVIELMKLQAQILDHIKRFNRQLLLKEGAMSDDAKDQFAQGITGAVLEVQTGTSSIQDIVTPIPYPQIQTDIYQVQELLKEYIVRISGQSGIDQGGTQKTTTRSLGELTEIQQGGSNRRSDKLESVENFIEDIASNLVALLQQFADIPYFVRISGDDPEKIIEGLGQRPSAQKPGAITSPEGFTFTREDIKGEFDFEVVAGSTKPLNSEQKMKTLELIAQLLPQLGGIPGGPVTQWLANEVADEIDMPGLKQAVLEEQKVAEQLKEEQAQQQDQMMSLQAAQQGTELQIKAEREATKQSKLQLEGLKTMHEMRQPQVDAENSVAKTQSEIAIAHMKAQHEAAMNEAKTKHEIALKHMKTKAEIEIAKEKAKHDPKDKPGEKK